MIVLSVAVGLCALSATLSVGLLLRVLSDAAQERQDWAAERASLLAQTFEERLAWTTERAELLTRIQRPEIIPQSARRDTEPHIVPDFEKQLAMVGGVFVNPTEVQT